MGTRIDPSAVQRGKVLEFRAGKRGEKGTGFGFVQVGEQKIFFHRNAYRNVKYQTSGQCHDVWLEIEQRGGPPWIPRHEEEIVLEVEETDRGLAAKWWVDAHSWGKEHAFCESIRSREEARRREKEEFDQKCREEQAARGPIEPTPPIQVREPHLSAPLVGESWWVVDGIYFCTSEENAELISVLQNVDPSFFDYAFGWDLPYSPEDEEEGVVYRQITEDDYLDDLSPEVLVLAHQLEGLQGLLETFFEEEDEQGAESICEVIAMIQSRIEAGQVDFDFVVTAGE